MTERHVEELAESSHRRPEHSPRRRRYGALSAAVAADQPQPAVAAAAGMPPSQAIPSGSAASGGPLSDTVL